MISHMKALEDEDRRLDRYVCGDEHAGGTAQRGSWKKVTWPPQRREMAGKAVALRGVSIALACRTFGVSETCNRYSAKMNDENEQIADLLIGLTRAKKNWGFGLCFLYLRNVRGHRWNHKRVYGVYRELELNLRIKPRKRLRREKPDALAVPERPNLVYGLHSGSS